MFLHQHFCVHYPFIFFIQTFYIRTIHYIIINLFQKFCPVCTPGDGSFFGIAPKEYDSFVEQVCLDFSHFASHACSTQDTHFRSGCLAICINDHKVPVIFGRLFALLVCTQIIVNTSLDFHILILYVKSIILYSFVERDNTLYFLQLFHQRREPGKKYCIFQFSREMPLKCFWTQDLSKYSELSKAFELMNSENI